LGLNGAQGAIHDWWPGDVIDFVNTNVTSVNKAGDQLTVTYNDNRTKTYKLVHQESNTEFKLQHGHGGTDLILVHVVGIAQAQHDVAGHLV
jgi:hypothetical protein